MDDVRSLRCNSANGLFSVFLHAINHFASQMALTASILTLEMTMQLV